MPIAQDVQDPQVGQSLTTGMHLSPAQRAAMLASAQAHLDEAKRLAQAGDRAGAQHAWYEATRTLPSDTATIDQDTGQIRDKTWWERNGDLTLFLIGQGVGFAGGVWLSGLNAAGTTASAANAGGAGTGVGLGETGAVAGLPGGASTVGSAGAFAGGVGPEISGAGLYGPGSAGFDAGAQTQIDPGPAVTSAEPSAAPSPLNSWPTTPNATPLAPGVGPSGAVPGAYAPSVASVVAPIATKGAWSAIGPALITTAAGAAGSIYGAYKQGQAQDAATTAQSEAAANALQFQRDELAYTKQKEAEALAYDRAKAAEQLTYDRTQGAALEGRRAPFVSLGYGAFPNLQRLTGQPVTDVPTLRPSSSYGPAPTAAPTANPNAWPAPNASSTGTSGLTALDPSQGLAQLNFQPAASGTPAAAAPLDLSTFGRTAASGTQTNAQAQTSSSYVTMRAPTGEVERVPASQVQRAESLGAERVA